MIGKKFKDTEGNIFCVAEYHSGFVWLRNERGDLKQIRKEELKHFTQVLSDDELRHELNEALRNCLKKMNVKVTEEISNDIGLEEDYCKLLEKFEEHLQMIEKVSILRD